MVNEKQCTLCGEIKSVDWFCKDKYSPDKYCAQCRLCRKQTKKIYLQSEQGAETTKRYRKTAKHKEIRKVIYNRSLQKMRARNAINNEVRRGRSKKPVDCNCVFCSKVANSYHHYSGYIDRFKLHVIPLCKTCHYGIHPFVKNHENLETQCSV